MPDLLFFLLLGHFVGDYALQSDQMAQTKGKSVAALSLHVFIYTITLGLFWWLGLELNHGREFLTLLTLIVLAGLYLIHWTQDFLKSRWLNSSRQSYYADQALHIVVLYIIRILF